MLSSLLHILQTPRFLLALSLSTVTAGVVACPLAVQAVRSNTSVAAQEAVTTPTSAPTAVQGVTLTAPATTDEEALAAPTIKTSVPTTTAIAEPVATTAPPATRAPTTLQTPTTRLAPTEAPTTLITLIKTSSTLETSRTSENAPGPVAPTITEPTTTTVDTDESTTIVVARPTSTTINTDTTEVITAIAPVDGTDPTVTTADPIGTGGSTTKPDPEPGTKEAGAGGWIPEIIDIIERSAGEQ